MFQLGHFAGDMFMAQSKRLRVISQAAEDCDVFTLSEVSKDHAAIRALLEFDDWTVGELSIAWRKDKFELVDKGQSQVMQGGRLGAGFRRRDKRRRGPSRLVIWVVLREKSTGLLILVVTHHAIAKADTAHKWRRRLRAQGFRGVVREILRARRRHPGIARVMTGDLNTMGRITAFARSGLRQVPTPATYGRLKYDRIYKAGPVLVDGVRRVQTAGDHKALTARVRLGVIR